MSFSGSCEQAHDSDAMLWHTARYTPDECAAPPAELARQRSTTHPRSLILGLARRFVRFGEILDFAQGVIPEHVMDKPGEDVAENTPADLSH